MKKTIRMLLAGCAMSLAPAVCGQSAAQGTLTTVTGTVVDETGEPLAGAVVRVAGPGMTTAVTTDVDGRYTISVPAGKSLTVSYIGFEPSTRSVKGDVSAFNFSLAPDASKALDELVVVGYGTQKKSEITGSIASVKGDKIKDFSVNSVADALAGMAAGVAVTKSTGSPGEAPDIIIRGAASVNGMAPLYIVDGVKQSTGFDFNMRDIESIEVLKDAGRRRDSRDHPSRRRGEGFGEHHGPIRHPRNLQPHKADEPRPVHRSQGPHGRRHPHERGRRLGLGAA